MIKYRHLLFSLSLHVSIFLCVGLMWSLSKSTPVLGDIEQPIVATFLYEDEANVLNLAKSKVETTGEKEIVKTAILAKKGQQQKKVVKQQMHAQHSQHSQGRRAESLVALLHAAIQAEQLYPAAAEQMQRQGRVTVAFTLFVDGHVSEVEVVQSSGTASLDVAAIEAVKKAAPFKAVEQYLEQAQHYTIDVIFQLA